ncbi:HNH endonuclease [Streptosporangium sp. KLBMP 9127]|nr:HNH endonuclease [Streptosporangium sp. KLBMP 9127]
MHDGRCAGCQRPPRKTKQGPRPTRQQLGYDEAWVRLSAKIRKSRPWCEAPSCGAPSQHVDHIDGSAVNNEEWNLQALCRPCHSRKTAKHDGGFGNPRTPRP